MHITGIFGSPSGKGGILLLHTDEVEILLPERVSTSEEMPLLLTVGPSLTMILPILVMAVFGRSMYGAKGGGFLYISLAAGISGAIAGAIWGALNHRYRKRSEEKKKKEKKAEFRRYLEKMDGYLSECADDNREYMKETWKSGEEISEEALSRRYYRLPGFDGFLNVRIGIGEIPFQMKVRLSDNVKQMFPDEEVLMAKSLVEDYRMLPDSPVLIDLAEEPYLGIAADPELPSSCGFLLQILLQLCVGIPPSKLKLMLFFDERIPAEQRLFEAVKFLPHVFADYGRLRLTAGNTEETLRLLPYLSQRSAASHAEHDLIVLLNGELPAGEKLFSEEGERGAEKRSVILVGRKRDRLPPVLRSVIVLPEAGSEQGFFIDGKSGGEEKEVLTETVSFFRAKNAFRLLSNDTDPLSEGAGIPPKVPFLDLYGVRSLSELEIPERYRKSRPDVSLRVPIGLSEEAGVTYLDLHERFHGPHGLVAGTTGSGKSEFLQSYLVSLCIGFSPEDVNFFVIDYKGGGTGNFVKELPHCAGVISNLSGSSINRALKAVTSENQRRQRILSERGVNHIDAYTELRRRDPSLEPVPHLILIVDEFAELKKEEPEFMQQIISLSAVGRSLGIHLILATQKPAGVVDDRIFSNSRFRLCLKVQDRQDSQDMLRRPEAAYLRNPGEAYLQVGNDEIFRHFQTGYLGDPYTEGQAKKEPVFLLSKTGQRTGLKDPASERREGRTLLSALTEYLKDTAEKLGYPAARSLWMEELPDRIPIRCSDAEKRAEKGGDGAVFLGLYDDPFRQEQGDVLYIPERMGHLYIAGGPSSGKTTVLLTMIPRLPGSFALSDLSQKGIFAFSSHKKCRGFASSPEELPVFFYHLKREFLKRKEDAGKTATPFFFLIDNFAAFFRALREEEAEAFLRMIAEGIGIRFYCIMTGTSAADLPSKIFGKVKTALALEMNDRFQYGDVLRRYQTGVYPKPGTPGRFLFRRGDEIFEGQIAVLTDVSFSGEETDRAKDAGRSGDRCGSGGSSWEESVPRFPAIPERPSLRHLEEFLSEEKKRAAGSGGGLPLPVGWSTVSGRIRTIDLSGGGTFLISGTDPGIANDHLRMLRELFIKAYPEADGERILFIPFLGDFLRKLSGSAAPSKEEERDSALIRSALYGDPDGAFVIGAYDPQRDADLLLLPLFRVFAENGAGIHLGGNLMAQRVLEFTDLSYSELGAPSGERCGCMRLPGKRKTIRIRIPDSEKEVTEDDYD